jgi:putative intracellular protease/amidase
VADHFSGREVSSDPVVVNGRVITSRGPGTAMLFALTLIERLQGKAAADAVAGPLCQP